MTSSDLAFLAAALAALLAACEPEDDAGGGADGTAGRGAAIEVAPEPSLSVGVLEGDRMQQFDGVVSAFLLPGGELAVADGGSSSIRIFAPDGTFLRSLGGPGEGPGELVWLRGAWSRGDTVEAWDSRARRITRWIPGGEVETIRIGGTAPLDASIGPLADGWALASVDFGRGAGAGGRDRMAALAFSREGEPVATLAELGGMARYSTEFIHGPHPLTPTALFAVGDGEVYAAETLTPRIGVYGAGGDTLREIPLPLDASGAPADLFRRVIDTAAARAGEDGEAAVRERLSAFPEPERLPLFWSLLVDAEGLVWVRPWDPFRHSLALGGRPDGRAGPGGNWLVLTPAGEELGRVAMPAGLEPLWIGADAVVGIHRDAFDVESVRVHDLGRAGPRPGG